MGDSQTERISVNRHEFEAFMSENRELIERYQRLLDEVKVLTQHSKELEERLQVFEQKESAPSVEVEGILAEARNTMKQLTQEADRRVLE